MPKTTRTTTPPTTDGFPYKTAPSAAGRWHWPNTVPKPGTRAFEAVPFPDAVPVLLAEDVAAWWGDETKTRKALPTWFEETFWLAGYVDAEAVAAVVFREVVAERTGSRDVQAFRERAKAADVAAAWNEMVRRLGYEVSAPKPWPKPKGRVGTEVLFEGI